MMKEFRYDGDGTLNTTAYISWDITICAEDRDKAHTMAINMGMVMGRGMFFSTTISAVERD